MRGPGVTDQEHAVLEQLELLIRMGNSVPEAAAKLAVMLDTELVDRVVAMRQEIAEDRRHIANSHALVNPEDGPVSWYTGPSENDRFWPVLKATLEEDAEWVAAVPSLDSASTDLVGLLADPHTPIIATRGLVVGYVQSGKTANFTATIAKAADAGYRLFIVLSGVHNALRRQTQLRLDQNLHLLFPTAWLPLTYESSDFGNPVRALPLVAGTDLRLMAVVKKNVTRLTSLVEWLKTADEHNGLDTCPVLIIDDEADQAGPNSAKNADLDRTTINALIVDLLKLPRVAYLGYTATPFANVLINPHDVADMYPRDFIYALPRPDSYFGAEELFGRQRVEDEEDETSKPHNMIRHVSEEEAKLHVVRKKEPFKASMTKSLAESIRWFLLATAARRARSHQHRHTSMLIHTTQSVDPQLAYLPVISSHLATLRTQWERGETDQWEAQWLSETALEPASRHGLQSVSFPELADVMAHVLRDVKVVADNSRSTARLIYSDDPATVIAVGGNTLSRGLTLHGLICSYFLRTASTYDSLLQMGRWFGFRPGYADLPRIWTTKSLADDFKFLSEIESDLRSDIERYAVEGVSPLDLPVQIRLHPRMQVTAARRLQFAVQAEASFSGRRPQTTYFAHTNKDVVGINQKAARKLIKSALDRGTNRVRVEDSRIVITDVSADVVLTFIKDYAWHADSEMNADLLTRYIKEQMAHGALSLWNLAVITRKPPAPTIDLGLKEEIVLITRSKLNSSKAGTANIGTLMSKPDRVADLLNSSEAQELSDNDLLDLRTNSGRALLLLYPIDKDSQPKSGADHRRKLGAEDHLIGVAFAFPRAAKGSEPTDKIQVDVSLLQAPEAEDELEAYEDFEGSVDEVDLDGA